MKKSSIYIIPNIVLGGLALAISSVALSSNGGLVKSIKATDSVTVTIDDEMLENTILEDYQHPNKQYNVGEYDKRFTISLGGNKIIQGAILFRDCGYQFTGNTLGDAFGINNTDNKDNAYNFNLIFSFENVTSMSINYSAYSTTYNYIFHQIKYSYLNGEDFYSSLNSASYADLVARADPSELYVYDSFATYEIKKDVSDPPIPDTLDQSFFYTLDASDAHMNMVAFNLNCGTSGSLIAANNSLEFTIKSLSFTYSCN